MNYSSYNLYKIFTLSLTDFLTHMSYTKYII